MKPPINLFLSMLLLLLFPLGVQAATNSWSGSGPFATVTGNRTITALAVSADGATVYAGNGSGTVLSYDIVAPTLTTTAASGITTGSATLNGMVNVFNAGSVVGFEYGPTTAYGSSVTAAQSPLSSSGDTAVSAVINGLAPGTSYHYRVVVTNNGTTYQANDASFAAQAGYTLTLTKGGSGSGTITPTGCSTMDWSGLSGRCTAPGGSGITLTGAADADSFFVGWNSGSGSATACTGTGNCSFTLDQDSALTGTFPLTYSVTVSPVTNGSISPSEEQIVNEGATASFTIKPAAGYVVTLPVGGTCGNGSYTGSPYDTVNGIIWTSDVVTASCTVAAGFTQDTAITYNVTISNSASAHGAWSGTTPDVWTPSASGANILASEVQSRLDAGTGVIIRTGLGGNGETGDIIVMVPLSWSAGNLIFSALHDVTLHAVLTASGSGALSVSATTGTLNTGFGLGGRFVGRVDFPGRSGTGFLTINGAGYTVINSLGAQGSTTGSDLQGISGNLSGKYALGADIDASYTLDWNDGAGFLPLGDYTTKFTGVFDGLGHTINNLFINRLTNHVGLFGFASSATLRNIGLDGGSVSGNSRLGGLVGELNNSAIRYSYNNGNISDFITSMSDVFVGGLAGYTSNSSISYSYNSGSVTITVTSINNEYTGGVVGFGVTTLSNCYNSGTITVTADSGLHTHVGGLAGAYATINNSYNSGFVTTITVAGSLPPGGLMAEGGTISNSYNSGSVKQNGSYDLSQIRVYGSNNAYTQTTTPALKQLSTFTGAGWTNIAANGGIGAVWRIYEGQSYPLLSSFLTPLTVTARDAVKPYDGTAYDDVNGVTISPAGYDNGRVLGSLAYSFNPAGGTEVGSYSIIPGGLYSSQRGYDITFVPGNLTVTGHTLTISKTGAGSGTISATGCTLIWNGTSATCSVADGANITLSGAAALHSTFSGWSGSSGSAAACSGTGDCTVTISADSALTGSFDLTTHTATPSAGSGGSITPATPQSMLETAGTSFTIIPLPGYRVATPVGGSCGGSYTGDPLDPVNGISYSTNVIAADCTVVASFIPIVCTAQPSGLMAWWKGAGTPGDLTGSHSGTLTNVSYATGKVGQAFSFSGADSYVTIGGTSSDFDFSNKPFSISAWIRVASDATGGLAGFMSIFDRSHSGFADGYRLDYSVTSHNIRLLGTTSLTIPATLLPDTWYHVVAVSQNGAGSAIYLNGAQIGATGTHTTSNWAVPPRIGECQNVGDAPFSGEIDELQIFNRALNLSEIQSIYNADVRGVCYPATLTVTIAGSGSITSQSTEGTNYACIKTDGGTCDAMAFNFDDQITLFPTGANSSFSAWSGAITGNSNPGSVALEGDKAVTATFNADPPLVRIDGDMTPYYSIGAALAIPGDPVTIRARGASDFIENIIMTNPVTILLKGGYSDAEFSNQSGFSIISGSLKVRAGKMVLERVKVKP